jgi:iron complex transport system permease protein
MTTSPDKSAGRARIPITGRETFPARPRRVSTVALSVVAAAGLLVSVVAASLFGSADIGLLDVVSTILRHLSLGGITPPPRRCRDCWTR